MSGLSENVRAQLHSLDFAPSCYLNLFALGYRHMPGYNHSVNVRPGYTQGSRQGALSAEQVHCFLNGS